MLASKKFIFSIGEFANAVAILQIYVQSAVRIREPARPHVELLER